MSAVTVRRAVREDAEKIAELAEKLVAQHRAYDPKRFARLAPREQMKWFYGSQTEAEDAAVLVAELDGRIVGFAYVQFESKNYAGLLESAAWLHDIYLEESARGQNAGKKLLQAAINEAKDLGAAKLMLTVAAQNETAQKFFERIGFKRTMVEMMLDLTE